MFNNSRKLILLIALIFIVGCSTNRNIIDYSYGAANTLLRRAPKEITKETPFLVTSFVNINDMEESTTLGRLLSEQIASKISQKGYLVKEIKLSHDSLFVKKGGGEFALTRRFEHVRTSFQANYVIVGTYSIGLTSVYVSSRIVRIDDGIIVSSFDFKMEGDDDLWELVKAE